MTYEEYRKQRQDEVNALPIFFAFSNKQFEEEMGKRGLTVEDTDKICRISGGFCLKSDLGTIKEFVRKPDPLHSLMNDATFAESAFYYEMGNHEYHINWQGDWDVCSCFGSCEYGEDKDYTDYLGEIGYSQDVIAAFGTAKTKFYNACRENDWY